MKAKTINQKIHAFLSFRLACLNASLESERYKDVFKNIHWRFSKKVKLLIVFTTILVMLVSAFAFLPKQDDNTSNIIPQSTNDPTASPSPTSQGATDAPKNEAVTNISPPVIHMPSFITQILASPKPPGIIETAQTINSTLWRAVAANAWQYFQPGIGVDSTTGLPGAGLGYPYFTDWDLGVYIQAVIDANKTGLIGIDGDWGSTARLDKVLKFLEKRDLNESTGYPFWFYEAGTGKNYRAQSDLSTVTVDAVDTGRLFVALKNLETFNPSLTYRIDGIVKGTRPNYSALLTDIKSESGSNSIYTYYVASGFAAFWPEVAYVPGQILDNMLKGDPVKFDGGITLPKSEISCEPLLHSIFELPSNPKLIGLARNVYLAHETKYNATEQFVAFSEGNSGKNIFIYEWVVLPTGETWKVTKIDRTEFDYFFNPIIYTKVAMGFLSLYNTTYARNMAVYLERSLPDPTSGYYDGADFTTDTESRNLVSQVGSNSNGLILSAARYAIQNNP